MRKRGKNNITHMESNNIIRRRGVGMEIKTPVVREKSEKIRLWKSRKAENAPDESEGGKKNEITHIIGFDTFRVPVVVII